MRAITLLLTLFISIPFLNAQLLDPVKWQTSLEKVDNETYDLVFKATVDKGWVLYSQHSSLDGPIPTAFIFDESPDATFIGKVKELSKVKEGKEPIFDNATVIKFTENPVLFKQRIKVPKDVKISGYVEYMSCNDEMCTPPQEKDFSFDIKVGDSSENNSISQVKGQDNKSSSLVEPIEEDRDLKSANGIFDPVKWSFDQTIIEENTYELTFTADLDEGWTLPSQHSDPMDGPIPTYFEFNAGDNFELIGEIEEEGKKKEGPDPLFDNAIVIKFIEGPVIFKQKVKIKDIQQPISGFLEYMTCDDARCLPITAVDFEFNLTGQKSTVAANTDGLSEIDQLRPSIATSYKSPKGKCGEEENARDMGLFLTFGLGFLGGLLALLTPCVFPMIPLTVSFFTKSSIDRKSGLRNALIYGLSIIVIYVSMGLLITAALGPEALNLLSTNWIANTLFFLIFIFFAFSFFGYYEITLPSSWANKSDAMADKGGVIGIFFMAFTLALVSFSCTGPIIGSAIVQSATDKLGPFLVMLGFSSALALPFALFAAFPGWLNSLPKSGSWMNSVKVVLGFLELALAFKFLSVADMVEHWNILPYEIFMASWVLVFGLLTAYIFGFIKFPHDSPIRKLSLFRRSFGVLCLVATIYLITGFFYNKETQSYNSLKLMSGLAPPANYNWFLPEPAIDNALKSQYISFTKCANNLDCFKDYYEGLAYAKETNKPILLDFTGYGCVNCRKTEEHIWIKDEVKEKLSKDFVLISLYVDDRKELEEVLLSKSRQKKLRNVGNKWADFQIVNFEQNSQPLYVIMSPEEEVLTAPRGYNPSVSGYFGFLDCGLNTFKRLSVN